MALTDEQKQVWLSEDFHRIVIADIDYHDGTSMQTLRVSSSPYIMPFGDSYLATDPYLDTTGNLLTAPEDHTDAAWTLTSLAAPISNTAINPSPILGSQVDTIDDQGAGYGSISQGVTIPTTSTEYTFTTVVKQNTSSIVGIRILLNGGTLSNSGVLVVDLTDGSNIPGIGEAPSSSSVEDLGNGYYRISVSILNANVNTLATGSVHPAWNSSLFGLPDPAATGSLYVWGSMLISGNLLADPFYGGNESNLIYDDIIKSVPNIATRIDSSSTVGAITLYNTDGEYDSLLETVTMTGHNIKIYIGDVNWPRDNFILILEGIVSSVSSNSPETIQLSLRDKKETLNVPLQSELFNTPAYNNAEWAALSVPAKEAADEFWHKLMDDFASTSPAGSVGGTRAYNRGIAVLHPNIKNTNVHISLGKGCIILNQY